MFTNECAMKSTRKLRVSECDRRWHHF
ncbi:hypothetical protein PUN28_008787 [Cardiocondyla obscurior]|uniref:Uncharacterized protein n=1 Tax=Cardiocondyla obscurior TaxID=286306 RepID=A0AAW2FQY9_9HYME